MTPEDMKKRTKHFGLDVIRLTDTIGNSLAARVIGGQLIRAATSVGANYRAACKGRSKAEFIAKNCKKQKLKKYLKLLPANSPMADKSAIGN